MYFWFYSDPKNTFVNTSKGNAPITIGDDVWLAMQSAVLPGSSIGDGAVLGVQAVLYNASVEQHCFAYGNPIKGRMIINNYRELSE